MLSPSAAVIPERWTMPRAPDQRPVHLLRARAGSARSRADRRARGPGAAPRRTRGSRGPCGCPAAAARRAQSTPWPDSSRTVRSPQACSAGSAEMNAVRSPRRAHGRRHVGLGAADLHVERRRPARGAGAAGRPAAASPRRARRDRGRSGRLTRRAVTRTLKVVPRISGDSTDSSCRSGANATRAGWSRRAQEEKRVMSMSAVKPPGGRLRARRGSAAGPARRGSRPARRRPALRCPAAPGGPPRCSRRRPGPGRACWRRS